MCIICAKSEAFMKQETKRISFNLDFLNYEFLQFVYQDSSDGALAGNFISEMINIVKIEMDKLKVFTIEEISELLTILKGKTIKFEGIEPKSSLLYVLKDHYKFITKTKANLELLKKIDTMSNLQIFILARFLQKFASQEEMGLDQAVHFFGKEDVEDFKIVTRIVDKVGEAKEFSDNLVKVLKDVQPKNEDEINKLIDEVISKGNN
jgi:hypothetical protein